MTTTDAGQRQRHQNVTSDTEQADAHSPLGRRPRSAQQPPGVAYATSEHLRSLASYLQQLTSAVEDTGWRVPNHVASFGEVEEETIMVGVRWINGAYHAEIR